MGNADVRHVNQGFMKLRTVWFTGTVALKKGQGLCYDLDYVTTDTGETATDAWGRRGNAVELPSITNNNAFAGVTVESYPARANGGEVVIAEPGSTCEVLVMADTVVNTTLLTCKVGAGGQGRFEVGKFKGRGSALALQTNASGQVFESIDGSAAANATGKIITKTGIGTASTVGDTLHVIGAEDDGLAAGTIGDYEITAVGTDTVTLKTACADGVTDLSVRVTSPSTQRALVYLYDGEESGCLEWINTSGEGGAATNAPMSGGVSIIAAGWDLDADVTTTLASGLFLGQKKYLEMAGEPGTHDYLLSVTGVVGHAAADGTGALASLEFDADGNLTYLEWLGTWTILRNSGTAIA